MILKKRREKRGRKGETINEEKKKKTERKGEGKRGM